MQTLRSIAAPSLDRRRFLALSGALGMSAAGLAPLAPARALAQAATPTASGPFAGYPELKLTVTDSAVTPSADTVPAGYVLLTVENQSTQASGAGIIGPGKGQTMADLEAAAATPTPENQLPPIFYTATVLGGPGSADPGGTSQAVVKFAAGPWVAFAEGNQPPAFLTATAGGGNQTAPASVVQVTQVNFAFGFERHGIHAGTQVWKVTNDGTQPHEFVVSKAPAGATFAQVLAAASLGPGATPEPGGLTPADFRTAGGISILSPGQSCWTALNLTPGRFAALCFVPDRYEQTMPHAMEGMIALFDVA
jgi:hypothetical protein